MTEKYKIKYNVKFYKKEGKRMRKKLMLATLALTLVAGSSITALAAPEVTPDGGVFDAEYYAENYPDVVQALGTDKAALYQHFVTFGVNEGRLPFAVGTDCDAIKAAAASQTAAAESTSIETVQTTTNPVVYPEGTVRVDEDGVTLIYAQEGVNSTLYSTGDVESGYVDVKIQTDVTYENVPEDPSFVAKPGYEWKRVKTMIYPHKAWDYGTMGWGHLLYIGDGSTATISDEPFSVTYNGITYNECEVRWSDVTEDSDISGYAYSETAYDVMIPQGCQYVYVGVCGKKNDGNGRAIFDESTFVLIPVK